jgi:hypothetical protein
MYVHLPSVIWWGGIVFPVAWMCYINIRRIAARHAPRANATLAPSLLCLCGAACGAMSLCILLSTQGRAGASINAYMIMVGMVWTVVLFQDSMLLSVASINWVSCQRSACDAAGNGMHSSCAGDVLKLCLRRRGTMVMLGVICVLELCLHTYAIIVSMAE